MMHRLARLLIGAITALLLSAAHADDLPSPPLLADMVEPTTLGAMSISPDGKHVAGIGYKGFRSVAFLIDADTLKTQLIDLPASTQSRYDWRQPIRVNWIASDLLAVDYDSEQCESIDLKGNRVARLGERFMRRVAGKDDSPDNVLVMSDIESQELSIVNARTGRRQRYPVKVEGSIIEGAFDDAGRLRAVTTRSTEFWAEQTKIRNWYRPDDDAPWRLLEEFPVTADYWWPVRVLPEPDSIAVLSRHERDTWALFRYDAANRRHVGLMVGDPNDDITAVRGLDAPSVEGVTTNGMKPDHYWFKPVWAAVQASVDAELPGRVNTLTGDPAHRVLIWSYGDVDPGHWYVLDVATMTMRDLGSARPLIDVKRMRPTETLQYKARDGLTINAYLTRPARPPGHPAPMVVLIHGGPNVRDTWSWNEEVQILVSYGYLVFQPQFRGSTGFGRRFEEAGYQEWGRAMQDDITDGVRELIARGIADPQRICIDGASYGGYAALWGVVSTPTLYKCGVSLAGVSDLEEMMSHSFRDDSNAISREIVRFRVGNPAVQRQRLAEVSPLKNAAKVQVPLLIVHGELDRRVLPAHSADMVAALRKEGKTVEWVQFANEGHGIAWPANRLRYYGILLSFLQRHIGDHDDPPAAVPSAASEVAAPPADVWAPAAPAVNAP